MFGIRALLLVPYGSCCSPFCVLKSQRFAKGSCCCRCCCCCWRCRRCQIASFDGQEPEEVLSSPFTTTFKAFQRPAASLQSNLRQVN